MVYVADTESWQRIFQLMSEKSRWDLPERMSASYLTRSFDFIIDFSSRSSTPSRTRWIRRATPLRLAKRVRRAALRQRWGRRRVATRSAHVISGCRPSQLELRGATSRARSTAGSRRQQLIHALRVGAAARLLHHGADEHALQLLLAGEIALCLLRMFGEHFVDPRGELRVVADLEQPFALRDLLRRFPGLDHHREDALRRGVADQCRRAPCRAAARGRPAAPRSRSIAVRARLSAASTSPITQFAAAFRVAVRARDGLEVVGDATDSR